MKKTILIAIFTVLSVFMLKAQKPNYFKKFGSITQEEVDMKTCSYDASANAVVLFDAGKSSFVRSEEGYDVLFQRITRIKILSEGGVGYANVEIPFYREGDIYEKVNEISAKTYEITDGHITNITELDLSTCFNEKTSENWYVKKFALPNVKPGCIIEYTYTIYSQYYFNLRDWEFQWRIPVLYSEYETRMIPFYEYTYILQGRSQLDVYESYEDNSALPRQYASLEFRDMVYRFGLKNVPAFVDEGYITSISDYIIKIDFQLSGFTNLNGVKIQIMTTWPELVKDYLKNEDFGKYINKSEKSAEKMLIADSILGKPPAQVFRYVVNFAKDNFKWNENNRQFADKSPSEFTREKAGNSAEINLWLVGALRVAGIEAYPVLLSTRSHGRIYKDYPFSHSFNFVVACAYIDGKPILADATDPFTAEDDISVNCLNDAGLLVDKVNLKWLSLQSPELSKSNIYIKFDSVAIDPRVLVATSATNYEAARLRNSYADNTDELISDLNKKMYLVDNSSVKINNSKKRSNYFSYNYIVNTKVEKLNNKLYISPFLAEVYDDNPLKQKTRNYPVDLTYPVNRTYKAEIVIPPGYKVDFLPEKSTLNDELFELNYFVEELYGSVHVSFSYTFKQAKYQVENYGRIKAFFDRIVKKGNEKIVLVKVS
jgi:hypothetical protein